MRFGVSALNVGGHLKYERESERLPTSFRAGAAMRPIKNLLITTDWIVPRSNTAYAAAGTEWVAVDSRTMSFILRAGLNGLRGRDLTGAAVSGGAGFHLSPCQLDYAFVPFGELGDTHEIMLTFRPSLRESPRVQ